MKLLFSTIIGAFLTDEKFKILEQGSKEQLLKKHRDVQDASMIQQRAFRSILKKSGLFHQYHLHNKAHTMHVLQQLPAIDSIINHTINNVSELNEVANTLVKRCREWYGLYVPEAAYYLKDNEIFIKKISEHSKIALL